MPLSQGVKLARVLACAAIVGLILGVTSRLWIVGNRSNVEILHSGWGWTAIAMIAVGLYGLVRRFYKAEGAIRILIYTLLVTGGAMWIAPLPH